MSIARTMVADGGMPASRPVLPGDLLCAGESISAGALTTAGDGTLTGALIATGIIRRTGPTGTYTDTTDTADLIIGALSGNGNADVAPGTSFRLLYQNTVAFAMTLAAGTGVKLGTGTTTIAASLVREYLITVLNASRTFTYNTALVSGSKVATLVFPGTQVAISLSPAQSIVMTPGMTVSGTNVTAGTKVDGLTYGPSGLTGFHMDTNASGTGTQVLTFSPSILIDSLRSSTL